MEITLCLEVNGKIERRLKVAYEDKELIAKSWHRMFPGKNVTVFYTVGSKINNQPVGEDDLLTSK